MPPTIRLRSATSNIINSIPVGALTDMAVIGRTGSRHTAILKTNLPTIARAEVKNRVAKRSRAYVVPTLVVNVWAAISAFAVD